MNKHLMKIMARLAYRAIRMNPEAIITQDEVSVIFRNTRGELCLIDKQLPRMVNLSRMYGA